jgi:hypothetical protein
MLQKMTKELDTKEGILNFERKKSRLTFFLRILGKHGARKPQQAAFGALDTRALRAGCGSDDLRRVRSRGARGRRR